MPKTATEPEVRSAPCRWCGTRTPLPDNLTTFWARCDRCRPAGWAGRAAAMLTAAGVDADPQDPVIARVLDTFVWEAYRHPATSRPPEQPPRSPFVVTTPATTGSDEPWQHIDAKAVRQAVARAQRRATPRRLPNTHHAPCLGCGVKRAVGWADYSPTRSGGELVCDECGPAYERADSDETFALHLLAQLLTVPDAQPVRPGALLEPFGFKHYAAAEGTDPSGYEERFGYLDADLLDRVRRAFWQRRPQHAPREMRARLERAARARAMVGTRPSAPVPSLVMPGASS